MTQQEREQSQKILNHFGEPAQRIKLGEECAELATTILQSLCPTKNPKKIEQKLYSELADVYNLMLQSEFVFDFGRVKSIAAMKRETCIDNYQIQ